MSKEENEKDKPIQPPPLNTNQILLDILDIDTQILKESLAQGKTLTASLAEIVKQGQTLVHTLDELKEQGVVLDNVEISLIEIENVLKASLIVQQDSKELLQQIVKLLSPAPPPLHVYTIEVYPFNLLTKKPKEGRNMAQSPGVGTGYGAAMQDNGNFIPLPDNSSWAWSTDDPTDQIVVSADGSVVIVTTTNPVTSGRTSITISAAAADPNGNMQSGSYTTDLTPGVDHTFTVSVAPLQINPERRPRPDNELPGSKPGGGSGSPARPSNPIAPTPGPKK